MSGSHFPPLQQFGLDIQELLNVLVDQVVLLDADRNVLRCSPAAGASPPTEVPKKCYELLECRTEPCGSPLWPCPLDKVLQSGRAVSQVFPRSNGGEHGATGYVSVSLHPLKSESGVPAFLEVRRDVTAERELENQVLRRHHHLQSLSRISTAVSELADIDAVLKVALDAVLEIVNGEIGGILLFDTQSNTLGYRVFKGMSAKYAEQMRLQPGEGIAGIVAQTGRAIVLEDISKDLRVAHRDLINTEGLKGFISVPLRTRDKIVGVMDIASHMPGRFSEDDLHLLTSIGRQIGVAIEQARLHDLLARASERYRVLLQHALRAQEEERKRIARELHDETSQALTSLTLSLQAIIGMAEAKGAMDEEMMDRLKKTHAYAVHAGNEIVQLMKELRPTLLDELGMPAAIRRYAKDVLEPHGIHVITEFKGAEQRFRPEVEVTLFRIAQGVIGNVLEHSGASDVNIDLECDEDHCVMKIRDDGRGFDVKKLTRVDASGRGAGLFTMKERVRLVGGSCLVQSRPGHGTSVTVKVPVAAVEVDEEDQGLDS